MGVSISAGMLHEMAINFERAIPVFRLFSVGKR